MFSDWTSADYFSNIASLVLFVVAYWLGKRQGQIIDDVSKLTADTHRLTMKEAEIIDQVRSLTSGIHRLQEAFATLQFREKMGVMKQRAFEVDKNPSAAITLLTDSMSVLDGYRFAPERLRREYVATLEIAFTHLCNQYSPYGEKKPMQLELAQDLVRHAKILFDDGERELAFSLMIPVANCALSLHKAGDFSLATHGHDAQTREKLEQLLSMSEPDLLQKLEAHV
jgi:hypothetical protein